MESSTQQQPTNNDQITSSSLADEVITQRTSTVSDITTTASTTIERKTIKDLMDERRAKKHNNTATTVTQTQLVENTNGSKRPRKSSWKVTANKESENLLEETLATTTTTSSSTITPVLKTTTSPAQSFQAINTTQLTSTKSNLSSSSSLSLNLLMPTQSTQAMSNIPLLPIPSNNNNDGTALLPIPPSTIPMQNETTSSTLKTTSTKTHTVTDDNQEESLDPDFSLATRNGAFTNIRLPSQAEITRRGAPSPATFTPSLGQKWFHFIRKSPTPKQLLENLLLFSYRFPEHIDYVCSNLLHTRYWWAEIFRTWHHHFGAKYTSVAEQWFSSITAHLGTNTVPLSGLVDMLNEVQIKRKEFNYEVKALKLDQYSLPQIEDDLSKQGLQEIVKRVRESVDLRIVSSAALHTMFAEFRRGVYEYDLIGEITEIDQNVAKTCGLLLSPDASCARFCLLISTRVYVPKELRIGVLSSCQLDQTKDGVSLYIVGRKDGTGKMRLILREGKHFCCSCPLNHENGHDCRHLISLVCRDVMAFDPLSSFAPTFLRKDVYARPVTRVILSILSASQPPIHTREINDWNWGFQQTLNFTKWLESELSVSSSITTTEGDRTVPDNSLVDEWSGDKIKSTLHKLMQVCGFDEPYKTIWLECMARLNEARSQISKQRMSSSGVASGCSASFTNPLPAENPGSRKRNRAGEWN